MLFITFFVVFRCSVSCLFRSWFVPVLFWWGMVLHYMHRRYGFLIVLCIAYLCAYAMPSMDSISIAAYSNKWRFSASFRAFNRLFFLNFGCQYDSLSKFWNKSGTNEGYGQEPHPVGYVIYTQKHTD